MDLIRLRMAATSSEYGFARNTGAASQSDSLYLVQSVFPVFAAKKRELRSCEYWSVAPMLFRGQVNELEVLVCR